MTDWLASLTWIEGALGYLAIVSFSALIIWRADESDIAYVQVHKCKEHDHG